MSKIPKKDIDRIFRDGSDRYDFPFNQEAWKNMEDLLDREKQRRVLIWWTAGILLFLLLILLFFWLKPSHSSPPSAPPEVSEQAIADLDRKSDTPNAGAAVLPPPPAEGTKNGDRNPRNVSAVDQQTNRLKAREEKPSRSEITTPPPARPIAPSQRPAAIAREPIPPVPAPSGRPETAGDREPPAAQQQTGRGEPAGAEPAGRWAPLSLAASLDINPLFTSVSRILPDLPQSLLLVEPSKNERRNHLLIGAAFSPELNSVGYRDLSAVSWKWGLGLEYQYAGKFGFTAGVHHVNKKYRAGAGAYTPPKGFWTRKIAPIETDGECTVLEIPVGLTFYPKGYDQSGFFSEVGMSSFLMLEEHYYYHYDVPDNDLVRYWGGENENRHWLGILNLSVGYHLNLSNHLSARLAPYTQIPLSGVGHGKVRLTNLGAQFSFHYNLPGR